MVIMKDLAVSSSETKAKVVIGVVFRHHSGAIRPYSQGRRAPTYGI